MNQKESILRSARKLFLNQGYHATSLKDIYNASNVSASMINYHYHSKEKLLLALLLRAEGPISEVINSYQEIEPSSNAMRQFIADTLKVMWAHRDDVILCLQEQILPSTISSFQRSSLVSKAHYSQFIRLASVQDEDDGRRKEVMRIDLLYHAIFDMVGGLFVSRKTDCFSKSSASYSLNQIQEFITVNLLGVEMFG